MQVDHQRDGNAAVVDRRNQYVVGSDYSAMRQRQPGVQAGGKIGPRIRRCNHHRQQRYDDDPPNWSATRFSKAFRTANHVGFSLTFFRAVQGTHGLA